MKTKKDWITLKFEDFVENITDRIEKPSESGLEYYIGLDHIDTDQIRIKRFGSTADVNATKFLCKKGDIIFGKRNSYLRKVAVTDRDAVVSAHSMIFRPKSNQIYPDFLPCFLQSSVFWKIAHSISEGSMSPTIKWKILAKQEFRLPPLDEQKKIAELLWAIEDNIEKTEKLIKLNEKLKQGLLNELLTKGIGHKKFKKTEIGEIPEEWGLVELGSVMTPNFGLRITQKKDKGTKYPVYGGGGVSFYTDSYSRENEFLIARFAMSEECVRFVSGKFYLLDSGLTINPIDYIPKEYLGIFLTINQRKVYFCGRGPAQKNLDIKQFLKILFPKPNKLEECHKIISIYNSFVIFEKNLIINKNYLIKMKNKLTNCFLEGKAEL